jgi:hypothetical protein
LLLHQHTAEEASARLELLESVLTAYWLEFSRIGVHLELSRNKLIVFWFATKEGYQERMRANRSQPFLNTRGYFDPVSRVLLLSDARDDPDRRRALAQIETNATRLEAFAQSLESLPRGARIRIDRPGQAPLELDRSEAQAHQEMLTRELKRDRLLWELDWQSLDLAVSAHELVHALVVATGLAPRFESFPTWMHEGLAMQFESVRGGRWGGLAGANLLRRQDWHATNAEADPALANLLLDRGFERGYNQSAYARAWSFVAYLRRDREGSWLGVLDRLRQPIPTQSRSKTWVRDAVLDAANLPLAELERDWLRFMSREGSTSDPVSTEQPRTGQ